MIIYKDIEDVCKSVIWGIWWEDRSK